MNNVRQCRNNVAIFNVEKQLPKRTKKKIMQIEYPKFKVLTTISISSLAPHVKRSMSKSTCKAAKVLKRL